ncbi:MAG: hypothetical protein AB7K04_16085 [Pseudorhodoplanes sp.]
MRDAPFSAGRAVALPLPLHEELDAVLRAIEWKLPPFAKPLLRMIRKPQPVYVRIPLGVALVLGGIFSVLPVLGIWMLPLGMLLLGRDVPAVCRLSIRMLRFIERKLPQRT